MDEPLSNLDAKLRVSMRAELTNLHKRLGVTTVYVTHDQIEAMTLGQRVAVIENGTVQQVAHPQELYRRPANVFVATFIGSPSMNVAQASVKGDELTFGQFRLSIPERLRAVVGDRTVVVAGLRPEAFSAAEKADGIEVQVAAVEHLGTESHVFFGVDAPPVGVAAHRLGDDAGPGIVDGSATVFIARLGPDHDVRAGEPLSLAVDASKLYLFDATTGDALLP
jgi:multiple sugar transport system ATP-binding protein